ncbi:unnamed protein product [Caenorhabditis sp. 36 PRJEB53466]|nr:unnamed protein product [Caenorhabditis sp. 36 PRJEB53466]
MPSHSRRDPETPPPWLTEQKSSQTAVRDLRKYIRLLTTVVDKADRAGRRISDEGVRVNKQIERIVNDALAAHDTIQKHELTELKKCAKNEIKPAVTPLKMNTSNVPKKRSSQEIPKIPLKMVKVGHETPLKPLFPTLPEILSDSFAPVMSPRPQLYSPSRVRLLPVRPAGGIRGSHSILRNRHRFTLLGMFLGENLAENRMTVAGVLTRIGVLAFSSEIHIPPDQNTDSYSAIDTVHRVTFALNERLATMLLEKFDGDECDLKKHRQNELSDFNGMLLMRELTEWDALRMDTARVSLPIFKEVYHPIDGFALGTQFDRIIVWQDHVKMQEITIEDLIHKNTRLFIRILYNLNPIGMEEMRSYAIDFMKHPPSNNS